MGSQSLRFAAAARTIAVAARRVGCVAPSYRSPPRAGDRDRTLRRRADGSCAVAVRLTGRPFVAVLADMVEGCVAANRVEGPRADELRRVLWCDLEAQEGTAEGAGTAAA